MLKEPWQYGDTYWCLVLKNGQRFNLWAEEIQYGNTNVIFRTWIEGVYQDVAVFNREQVAFWYWANPITGDPVCGKEIRHDDMST